MEVKKTEGYQTGSIYDKMEAMRVINFVDIRTAIEKEADKTVKLSDALWFVGVAIGVFVGGYYLVTDTMFFLGLVVMGIAIWQITYDR